MIAHAGKLGRSVKAARAKRAPEILHHEAPRFFRLDLVRDEMASAAFFTVARGHARTS
jgi:hypothetical protein